MQLQQKEVIEKRRWEAVGTLRTNSYYASNSYFMLVMGLIFLRHTYRHFLSLITKLKPLFQLAVV